MRIQSFLFYLKMARVQVSLEIADNNGGGKFARGLANEGYAGGYKAALDDVEAVLTHGYPSDSRDYWKVFTDARDAVENSCSY